MIRVEIAGKQYQIPSNHKEITARQLHSIKDDKPKEIIKALTSIPPQIIDKLKAEAVLSIHEILSFIYEPPQTLQKKKRST